MQFAERRVERREELVGGVHAAAGQAVEQRRFAGVGIADQRDRAHRGTVAGAALCRARDGNPHQPAAQELDALRDQAPVGLQLRFAGTAEPDAAFLPLEVGPAAGQAGGHVIELRQLDLQLAFRALCALGEDIEDQARAIDYAA